MDDENLDRVGVRLQSDDQKQSLQRIHDLLVEEDRWNDDLSAAETIRRVLGDYLRVRQELQQTQQMYQGLIQFLQQQGDEEVLQQYRQAVEQEMAEQAQQAQPAEADAVAGGGGGDLGADLDL